jgi:hypothetical protein
VFCHGGVEDLSGAPPKNLDGTLTVAESMFAPHYDHINTAMTEPFDCVECHVKATDVLSQGHVFDDTPGMAEVDLGGGRSRLGTYDPANGCESLYCHGNGQGDNGSLAASDPPMTCESCHVGSNSPSADLDEMSGRHSFHVSIGAGCQDCHQATTDDGLTIAMPSLHINGLRDNQFSAPGFSYDQGSQSCTGSCHGYLHNARPWLGSGGRFHPAGFANPDVHSPDMELQRMDCRDCHAADLTGNLGPSSEGEWETMSGKHRKHLKEGFNCGNCHLDVTEDGLSIWGPFLHVDGANQIRFTDLSISYNPATGRCSGDCHGKNHEDKSW